MTEADEKIDLPDEAVPEGLFPIRDVVRLTGINPVTLRAWERRYGLIKPLRTEGGHRLYTAEDIATIQQAIDWTNRGVAASKVGELLLKRNPTAEALPSDSESAQLQHAFQQAIAAYDSGRMGKLYERLMKTQGLPAVEAVLLPLWRSLGQRNEFGARSQWLFLDAFLRARFSERLGRKSADKDPVLMAALADVDHELELLGNALMVGGDRIAIQALPPGMPLEELPLVCSSLQPAALVLFGTAALTAETSRRVARLQLSLDCPIAIAGTAAELSADHLKETPIACLGSTGSIMHQRLVQFLAGHLDT